jgi:hypothetical protein
MRGFRFAKCVPAPETMGRMDAAPLAAPHDTTHARHPAQHQMGPRGDEMMAMMREMMAPLMPM